MIIDVASLFPCYASIFPEHALAPPLSLGGSIGARVEREGSTECQVLIILYKFDKM